MERFKYILNSKLQGAGARREVISPPPATAKSLELIGAAVQAAMFY
jgi:hypothetical protein